MHAFAPSSGAQNDYAETIYRKLGIDTHVHLNNPDGPPTDGGRPIKEVF